MAAAVDDSMASAGIAVISVGMGCAVGYLLLQPLMAWWFTGRWRTAALLPLILTVPLLAHTLWAFAAQSNLWPVAALFLLPLACLYLVGLLLARLAALAFSRRTTT
jgi:hypothetical protein